MLTAPATMHRLLDRLWSKASLREREIIKRVLASFSRAQKVPRGQRCASTTASDEDGP